MTTDETQVTLLKTQDIRRLIRAELGVDRELIKQAVQTEISRLVQEQLKKINVSTFITNLIGSKLEVARHDIFPIIRQEIERRVAEGLRGGMKVTVSGDFKL